MFCIFSEQYKGIFYSSYAADKFLQLVILHNIICSRLISANNEAAVIFLPQNLQFIIQLTMKQCMPAFQEQQL